MAGWALGLALFGCTVVSLVLAVVFAAQVLVESRREQRDHGRSLAIATLAVAGVWVVIIVLFITSGTYRQFNPVQDRADPSRAGLDQQTPNAMWNAEPRNSTAN